MRREREGGKMERERGRETERGERERGERERERERESVCARMQLTRNQQIHYE